MQRLGRNFSKSTQLFIDEQNKNRLQFRFCNKSKKTVVNLRIVVPAKAFQFTLFVVPICFEGNSSIFLESSPPSMPWTFDRCTDSDCSVIFVEIDSSFI